MPKIMKPIRNLEEDDVRMPYWKNTDNTILKVKDKLVNTNADLKSAFCTLRTLILNITLLKIWKTTNP